MNVTVSIPSGLIESLPAGKNTRSRTLTAIERYLEIIRLGRREVRQTFTNAEIGLLADISNGTVFEPFGLATENNVLLLQYDDARLLYQDAYEQKHNVENFREKLAGLSKTGQIALIAVIEEFWAADKTIDEIIQAGLKTQA